MHELKRIKRYVGEVQSWHSKVSSFIGRLEIDNWELEGENQVDVIK